MSFLIRFAPYLLIFALGFGTGHRLTQNHYVAQMADQQKVQAVKETSVAKANLDKLRAAQSLADVLTNSLANAEANINATTLETTREIHHYATGNICFNAELTRLLNDPFSYSANISSGEASSRPVAEDASVTTPQGVSLTDTDVAEWIANAQGQYETCRKRLNSLIDFEILQDGNEKK